MKKSISIFLLLASTCLFAQEITGDWFGLLSFQGTSFNFNLNISETKNGYDATFASLDQADQKIPVTEITFTDKKLKFAITPLKISYEGTLNANNVFEGNFKQGISIPLNFSREMEAPKIIVRSDEPQPPFPYKSEDIFFDNTKQNVTLAGTLTLPQRNKKFPVAILVSGSGAQDRNEEIMGHKPFLKLADYLTRRGIGVLRYDDRGTAKSTGNYGSASTQDLATDTEAAVAYLRSRDDVDLKKIGIIGHSEGGIIAPLVASSDKKINFIVLLAGTGIRGDSLLLLQQQLLGKASGAQQKMLDMNSEINRGLYKLMNTEKDMALLKPMITEYFKDVLKKYPSYAAIQGINNEEMLERNEELYTSKWLYNFITFDPAETLQKVKCPVLAVNGTKDLQVPFDENLKAIYENLKKGGNKDVTIVELPNMNHLFQETETGAFEEYEKIEYSFSAKMLNVVGDWIEQQVK